MRQPFFSIVSCLVYLFGAMLFGALAHMGGSVSIAGLALQSSVLLAASGLFFIMAYFSLVHLKYK